MRYAAASCTRASHSAALKRAGRTKAGGGFMAVMAGSSAIRLRRISARAVSPRNDRGTSRSYRLHPARGRIAARVTVPAATIGP